MKTLKELSNRLPKNLCGIIMKIPDGISKECSGQKMRLESYNNNVAFFRDNYKKNQVYPIRVLGDDFLNWEVSEKNILINDGDYVLVNGELYGLTQKERVKILSVKEDGGSPYPYIVEFENGCTGQYKREEVIFYNI